MTKQSRTEARAGLTDIYRIARLEEDGDIFDDILKEVKEDIKTVKNILFGVLVSVTTASILLMVNVLVVRN
jgi:hypothetical protein